MLLVVKLISTEELVIKQKQSFRFKMLFDCLSDHQGDVMRKPTNIAEKDEDLKMAESVQQQNLLQPCQTTPLQEDSLSGNRFSAAVQNAAAGAGASFRCIYWSPGLGNSFSLICMVIISIKCLQCRIWAYSDLNIY